jgi:hypothetical protein
MRWYSYFAYFFGGTFLVNAIPHFVNGVSGRSFPTPFALPPGQGRSSKRALGHAERCGRIFSRVPCRRVSHPPHARRAALRSRRPAHGAYAGSGIWPSIR